MTTVRRFAPALLGLKLDGFIVVVDPSQHLEQHFLQPWDRPSLPACRTPWMALTPPELVDAHLKLDQQVMDALRKTKAPVVPT
jgi:hypothetical protein